MQKIKAPVYILAVLVLIGLIAYENNDNIIINKSAATKIVQVNDDDSSLEENQDDESTSHDNASDDKESENKESEDNKSKDEGNSDNNNESKDDAQKSSENAEVNKEKETSSNSSPSPKAESTSSSNVAANNNEPSKAPRHEENVKKETVSISVSCDKFYFNGTYEYRDGLTVYEVLKNLCSTKNIELKGSSTYIKSINGLKERSEGPSSGWMYKVNGVFPKTSCGSYKLKPNDNIEWVYTKDGGKDVGERK